MPTWWFPLMRAKSVQGFKSRDEWKFSKSGIKCSHTPSLGDQKGTFLNTEASATWACN